MRYFFTSLAFISRLPVPQSWQLGPKGDYMRLPRYFWVAGLALGTVNAAIAYGLGWATTPGLTAAVMAGLMIALAGAFHEDGFADVADAFGGYTVEKRFEIMRDSRLGTFGVSALGLLLLVRYAGFVEFTGWGAWALPAFLVLAGGWTRWTAIVMLELLPYVHAPGKGIAKGLKRAGWPLIVLSALLLAALTLLWEPRWLAAFALAQALTLGTCQIFFKRFLGGVNGDCLGASAVLAEILSIICLSALT
ncbi:MAG: adenosylcobinamide-GDP ribazoletransferase [Puniceicoccaceae bacterium 5H]|nr:MAG: adenosylcobinamide-GDP ribazoletransferase [Puniceicoccaceae bacterium 5H]